MSDHSKEADLQAAAQPRTTDGPIGLEQLFVEHQSRVFKAAYRVTGNAQDAEDVLQTVFMRLARRDEASLPQENLGSYLYRSAVNAAFDVLRARRRVETVDVASVENALPQDDAEGPERSQQGAEVRERLRRALARLNAKHAEMFALRYLEGYQNNDIARMLGVSRITVAVVLHRVRQRLQRDMKTIRGAAR